MSKIDKAACITEIDAYFKERNVKLTPELVMENLVDLFARLVTKGLVKGTDTEFKLFVTAARKQYTLYQIRNFFGGLGG